MKFRTLTKMLMTASLMLVGTGAFSSEAHAASFPPLNDLKGVWNEPLHFHLDGTIEQTTSGVTVTTVLHYIINGATLTVKSMKGNTASGTWRLGSDCYSGVIELPATSVDPATKLAIPSSCHPGGSSVVQIVFNSFKFKFHVGSTVTFSGMYTPNLMSGTLTETVDEGAAHLAVAGKATFTKS